MRYLNVVAEELHFGRAAARLYITQPALSQAIARLERLLEVRLLRRTRNNVELTEAGAEVFYQGRRLLADLERSVERVRMAGRAPSCPFSHLRIMSSHWPGGTMSTRRPPTGFSSTCVATAISTRGSPTRVWRR